MDIIQNAKKLLPCFCTAGVFVRLLRAINKLFLYQEVLKQNIGYYIILILIFNRSIGKADR